MSALDITLKQGKTFSRVFRWGSEPSVFAAISAITKAGQAVVTATTHGMPTPEWMAAVVSVLGMTEINCEHGGVRASDYTRAQYIDANTVRLVDVNSAEFTTYLSGGYLRFFTPVDLTGYTARMKIKNRPGGTEYLSLVSPTDIVLDTAAKTITVTVSATATALLTFKNAVYDLELVSAGGIVTEIASGGIALVKEVTA